jgi:hypothetical protein
MAKGIPIADFGLQISDLKNSQEAGAGSEARWELRISDLLIADL